MEQSYARFFNKHKSMSINPKGTAKAKKRLGRLVWDSNRYGTYVFAKHGELN